MKKGLIYLILSVIFLFSCKKDEDKFAPRISITNPYENQSFIISDTINIIADISDETQLEFISLRILDDHNTTVSNTQTFHPDSKSLQINFGIHMTDMLLPTGNYCVQITASDGTNTTNEFRKIVVQALTKKLHYILVLTKNTGTVSIHKIDSLNNISLIKTIPTDYCGSAVSSDAQQFYISGKYSGDVLVYSLSGWELLWDIPVIENPPFPYFEAADVYEGRLFLSFREGLFKIYSQTGSIIASHVTEGGRYPQVFLPLNDYLLTYEASPDGMQKYLMAYFMPLLAVYKKIPVTYDVLDMFPINDNECLMFCNQNGQGIIKSFSFSNGDVTTRYYFTAGTFTGATAMDSYQYLFSSQDKIWYFNYDYKGFTQWTTADNPQNLLYDKANGSYYFTQNYFSVIKKRFLPSETITLYDFQDTVINIIPVYNRD